MFLPLPPLLLLPLLLSSLLLVTPLHAAPPAPPVPSLNVPAPSHDFGSVTGRYAVHTFMLRNAGKAPLTVTHVRACCGARYELTSTNLPPSTTADLRAFLDLAGRTGSFRKTLYLHTNDPLHPITALRLSGTLVGAPGGVSDDFDNTPWENALKAEP